MHDGFLACVAAGFAPFRFAASPARTYDRARIAARAARTSIADSIPMTTALERAARELADRRRSGRRGPRLPAEARPADVDGALALQYCVSAEIGDRIDGWKCALPSGDRTIVAPLFASTVWRASPCAMRVRGDTAPIEPEIAFVLAQDLPSRAAPYGEADVRAAIGATHIVLELMDNRYDDPASVPFPELLADFANNQGLYVGPRVERGVDRPLERIPLTIRMPAGVLLEHDGAHPDGHPLKPLVWLANFLPTQRRGQHLRAGDIVTTGSYAGARDVPLDVPLWIEFGDLGTIAVELTAQR
jgi:2-keto-4-pentenoate hydratase